MSEQLNKAIGYIYDSNGYYDQKYYFDVTLEYIANFITLNKITDVPILMVIA